MGLCRVVVDGSGGGGGQEVRRLPVRSLVRSNRCLSYYSIRLSSDWRVVKLFVDCQSRCIVCWTILSVYGSD